MPGECAGIPLLEGDVNEEKADFYLCFEAGAVRDNWKACRLPDEIYFVFTCDGILSAVLGVLVFDCL